MQTSYKALVEAQRAYFETGETRNLKFRVESLKKLKASIIKNHDGIVTALGQDFSKCGFETLSTEVMGPLDEINLAIKCLSRWAKPQKVKTPLSFFPASSYFQYEPFGTVLVITAWNYPFLLALSPLVGALAAGNCCIVKPSELAPHTSDFLKKMLGAVFPENYCAVVEGGKDETLKLIKEPLNFIHYTGSSRVGKIIAREASENLVPVVLELGGKSPCIIDETANLEVAAKRIAWGKFVNAGQTCVAPDYLMVHHKVKDQFVSLLRKTLGQFYGDDIQESPDFCRIINLQHFDRLAKLLDGGNLVFGGRTDRNSLYIEPTIIDGITEDMPVMDEEIFGPILPILQFSNRQEAIKEIQKRDRPLALYIFSESKTAIKEFTSQIPFGGGCINSTLMHTGNIHLPFGGNGFSGMGNYHGPWSFTTFSHQKSILKKPTFFDFDFIYPPYKKKDELLRKFVLR